MTRTIMIALTIVALSTTVSAQSAPTAEEREELHSFIESLRDTYDAATDGSFRDYVTAAAADAGIDLPERGPRGGGDRPDRGGEGDRPERGADADRPEGAGPRG